MPSKGRILLFVFVDLDTLIVMSKRIGLFGGSFNPIHRGHLIIARTIMEQIELERVIFLPATNPPHKQADQLLCATHRGEMVRLAIAGESGFDFSDYDMTRDGPSFTIDTVNHFQQILGSDVLLHWIIGADSLVELTTWRQVNDLIDICQIITAVRPGWENIEWEKLRDVVGDQRLEKLQTGLIQTPLVDISSTDIRHRMVNSESISELVPASVASYIENEGLYR